MYQFGPGVPWGKGGLINDEPEVMYAKQGGQIEKPTINRFKNVLHK